MVRAPAIAALLSACLLPQQCACDGSPQALLQARMEEAARRVRAAGGPPRSMQPARRLQRRLMMSMEGPAAGCALACPALAQLETSMTQTLMKNMMSSGMSDMMSQFDDDDKDGDDDDKDLDPAAMDGMVQLMTAMGEARTTAYCANRPAVQCVLDNPSVCGVQPENTGFGNDDPPDPPMDVEIVKYAPHLDCLCDACPGAKTSLAKMDGLKIKILLVALGEFAKALEGLANSFSGQTTTTAPEDDELNEMISSLSTDVVCALVPMATCMDIQVCDGVLDILGSNESDDGLGAVFGGNMAAEVMPAASAVPALEAGICHVAPPSDGDSVSGSALLGLGWPSALLALAAASGLLAPARP